MSLQAMEGFFIREVFAILAACCAILEPMIHVFAMGVALLVVALLVGFMVVRLPLLRKLFLPTAVASGLLLLLLGPEIAGKYIPMLSLPPEVYTVWSRMPPLLINVVFATLFLGKPLLKIYRNGQAGCSAGGIWTDNRLGAIYDWWHRSFGYCYTCIWVTSSECFATGD